MPHLVWSLALTFVLTFTGSLLGFWIASKYVVEPATAKVVANLLFQRDREIESLRKELAETNKLLTRAFSGIAFTEHKLASYTGRHDLFHYMPDLYGDIECLRDAPPPPTVN